MDRSRFPADAIEREIPNLEAAEGYLERHREDLLAMARVRTAAFTKAFGDAHAKLVVQGYSVTVICLARMLARHGSMAGDHYQYHDELHAVDLLDHLYRLYRDGAAKELGPFEWMYLAMFASSHDLRQGESGYDDQGVGNNERASADEVCRIMEVVGFNIDYQTPLFQLLRWMIYGTTFFPMEVQLKDRVVGPGALSRDLARRIREHGRAVGELTAEEASELVLLASDIDTANVSQSIDQFAERSVQLCNEFHNLQGHEALGAETAQSVFDFLTRGQEKYFFVQQRFNSRVAQQAFEEKKAATGQRLRALTRYIRDQYGERVGNDATLTGEAMTRDYLEQAARLARKFDEDQ